MTNVKLKTLDSFGDNEKCIFCRTKLVDVVSYGPIYEYEGIITHYFCMLLSSQIIQNGKDKDGIWGFLIKDIKKEVQRGYRLKCKYCKKNGATIGCAVKVCRTSFHLPCGLANQSMSLFYGHYDSYCKKHQICQSIPQSRLQLLKRSCCLICLRKVSLAAGIWATCCETTWYHKKCIQEVAINSGYYFRCPNCNDKKKFRKSMLQLGVYIPDQDASWEREPNAFSSLTERYSRCDAEICYCPNGRDASQPNGNWEIVLCYRCLRKGVHKKCGQNDVKNGQWTCSIQSCLEEVVAVKSENLVLMSKSSENLCENSQIDEFMYSTTNQNLETKPNVSDTTIESPNCCDFVIKYGESDAFCNENNFLLSEENLLAFPIKCEIQEDNSEVGNSSGINQEQIQNSCRCSNHSNEPEQHLKQNREIRKLGINMLKTTPMLRKRNYLRKCRKNGKFENTPVKMCSFEQTQHGRSWRKTFEIDKEIVRVFPSVFKSLKGFYISLN